MGKRVNMGNTLFPYLQNPVAVFPIFKKNNIEFPKYIKKDKYDRKSILNNFPEFSIEYLKMVDSCLIDYSKIFKSTKIVASTGLNWMDYTNCYRDSVFNKAMKISDTLLGTPTSSQKHN